MERNALMARDTRKIRFEITAEDAGLRLDQALAARVPGLSRRKARLLLDIGGVFVDRKRVKVAGRVVRAGQVIEAHVGGALERASKSPTGSTRAPVRPDGAHASPQEGAQRSRSWAEPRIVHEDEEVIVVDKPSGLVTAPTPESDRGTLIHWLESRYRGSALYVVHRIDLETSGLLVVARSRNANRALSERFREHAIEREYIAILAGDLRGRDAGNAGDGEEIAVRLAISGRRAVTYLRPVERIAVTGSPRGSGSSQKAENSSGPGSVLGATVVRARLETGRTHQIRIHCKHLGHPVLGDRRYGSGRRSPVRWPRELRPPRMALHATILGFPHPGSGQPLRFESPLPEDLSTWLASLSAKGESND